MRHALQLGQPSVELGEADAYPLDLGDTVDASHQMKATVAVEFDQVVAHLIVWIADIGGTDMQASVVETLHGDAGHGPPWRLFAAFA